MAGLKQIENGGNEVSERMKLMLDSSPLCCQIWDENLNLIDCNEAGVKLYGFKDKQEYIDRFFELLPKFQPDGQLSSEAVFNNINTAFAEGSCIFEWQHLMPDGTFMPAKVTLVRVLYENKYVVAGYTEDLREHNKMMNEIRHRDNLLLAVNQAANVLLKINDDKTSDTSIIEGMEVVGRCVDTDCVELWQNEIIDGELHAVLKQYWHTEAGSIAKSANLIPSFPYNDTPDWQNRLARGEIINGPVSGFSSADKEFLSGFEVVSVLIFPFFVNGQFWGFCCIDNCRDTYTYTDEEVNILQSVCYMMVSAINRRELAEKVNIANVRARLMLDSSPMCCEIWDSNFNIIDCNEATVRFFGLNSKDEYLDNVHNFSPEFQPDGQRSDEKIAQNNKKVFTEGTQVFEWQQVLPDGTLVPTEVTLIPIQYGDGTAIVAYTFDLRVHYKMINEINQRASELAEAFEQVTAASKAKSDFLSSMSHEMRTPMNAIIGMTAIGKKAANIEEKDYALGKIGEASSHLLGVINDILDMAKIEANKLELVPIEYNFERMMQKVIAVTSFRLDEKEQTLSIHLDDKIPRFVVGDDQRLTQIITNLMANAVKFTPEGGKVSLTASLIAETDTDCEIKIEVTDSGIGISPEQQERLFQAFEQAESGTSREYGGTGLGLTITKSLVELMGGTIWIDSEIKKGAKFSFTVKLKRGVSNPRSLLAPGVNWETMRILAVDDMPEVREQFLDMFSLLDIKCDVASDGLDACRIIDEQGGYDIYFIDWRMPKMDGIELTRKIKSRNDGRPSVIIMITAMDWEQVKDEATAAGVDKHMLKPLSSSVIIDCVNECLGKACRKIKEKYIGGEFAGKQILLAEDVEINREILISLLEDTGISIDCAENGKQALKMVEAAPTKYDLIFMDVQMPKMDGHEATRRIRALPALQGVTLPIIATTANVFKSDIEDCIAAGMDGHIGKPLDIDKVLEVLRRYLR
ncbi:MAG: response regulator [Lachnospiraceae bacterium]|nr:response regulator [Lachnospiraceae bacterium]